MIELGNLDKLITNYRNKTFHISPKNRLKNERDAIDFVNERGFVFFWPIKDIKLPSLWTATVGDRPVPNTHDDPGHITWRWKDGLLDKGVWYYSKLLRRKSTIVSLKLAPFFYALSPNYGDFQNDFLLQYQKGLMTVESKNVYQALLEHGPLHSIELRQKARLTSNENKYRFDKALIDLQTEMKVLPTGIASAGRWNYAMTYDIVARYNPEIEKNARFISEAKSQERILNTFFHSVGLANLGEITKLFGWKKSVIEKTCKILKEKEIILHLGKEEESNPIYILRDILKNDITLN